jgi:hypothetical protein
LLYRFSLERCYLDTMLERFIARPFVALFRWFDKLERSLESLIEGRPKSSSAAVEARQYRL